MTTFKDGDGREWRITITVGALRRLRKAGCDLLELFGRQDGLMRLYDDSVLVVDMLSALLAKDFEARKLPAEAFEESLTEEHIAAGRDAILQGLERFFTGPRADLVRHVRRVMPELRRQMMEEAGAAIERTAAAAVAGLAELISGEKSTSSPDASDAIPALSLGPK